MIAELFRSGVEALAEYLSAHVLTCLIPAFFIAGAIAVFISQASVMKYFGARANKWLSYGVASVSGTVLAVCSCTILPLFAGIRQRGAGLGPAVTFLYAGPAINVLAIIYSARLLGMDIGIARAVGAVVFSIVTGLLMAAIFKNDENGGKEAGDIILPEDDAGVPIWKNLTFFVTLVILLVSAASIGLVIGYQALEAGKGTIFFSGVIFPAVLTVLLIAAVLFMTFRWHSAEERVQWMEETWWLLKKIIPVLLAGVFIAGIVKVLLPEAVVQKWVGGNSIANNLLASVFGALMYFSTLTEVPIVKALTELGMGKGPALTLLLAGPSLSLPNMIVIGKVMGVKKTAVYVVIVIVMSTLTGLMFGAMV